MLREIRPAIVVLVALTLITGLVYPLVMTGIAGVIFPRQAKGSLIERDGKVVGSELIGQAFTSRQVLPWPTVGDHGARSQRCDQDRRRSVQCREFGRVEPRPSNKALIDRVQGDIDALKKENPSAPVPSDLVTTSASGLDPHISPEAALFQVPGLPKPAICPKIASASSSRRIRKVDSSAFWASRA